MFYKYLLFSCFFHKFTSLINVFYFTTIVIRCLIIKNYWTLLLKLTFEAKFTVIISFGLIDILSFPSQVWICLWIFLCVLTYFFYFECFVRQWVYKDTLYCIVSLVIAYKIHKKQLQKRTYSERDVLIKFNNIDKITKQEKTIG